MERKLADLYLQRGAGACICDKETTWVESLEGKQDKPHVKPPLPADIGIFSCLTTIANIETAAFAPKVYRRSGSWFASFDQERNQGTNLFRIRVHVSNPRVVEEATGIPFKDLLEKHCGDIIRGWDTLVGIIPGGSSIPVLPFANK